MKPLFVALTIVLASALTACSKTETPPVTSAAAAPQTYDMVAANAKGFTVGSLMSVNTVYVLFDPQCPHCGHLWAASQPLLGKAKFVWVPVAIINGNSAPQGAALLSAPNPVEAMNLHEASLLAGTGGTPPSGGTPADMAASIKKNTELFGSLKLESVPFLVARHPQTGQFVSHSGAMDTASLAQLLGLN
ncbi:MAG: DsbC family protein [Rhodoferax sp.]|nr:DsbC family protein [Rhodoferax sp.]